MRFGASGSSFGVRGCDLGFGVSRSVVCVCVGLGLQ